MFVWLERLLGRRRGGGSRGSTLWRPPVNEEVRADLDFHLDMLAHDLMAAGVPSDEAQARARADFPDYPDTLKACRAIAHGRERDQRRSEWYRGLRHDVVGALRQLRRKPSFSLLAAGMIALGVGATSGIFSVVNGVLLTPLPYPDPGRLLLLCESNRGSQSCHTASPPNALDLARLSDRVTDIGLARSWTVVMEAGGVSRGVAGGLATPDYFRVLQTTPALGRLFLPEDQNGVGSPVAVVSHDFWLGAFGGDSSVVGRPVSIDGVPFTIVGVLPEGFRAPFLGGIELWRPLHIDPAAEEHRDWRGFRAVGRLAPGATVVQAQDELSGIAVQLAQRYPDSNRGWTVQVATLHNRIVGSAQSTLWLFLGAVGFVLLIACANVANLLLARAADRRREMAVRAAIGAGRRRLIRLVLIESLLLASVGGLGGFVVGVWATDLFLRLAPPEIPRLDMVGLDWTVFLFAFGITLGTSVLFGLVPALHASQVDMNDALKASAAPGGGRRGGGRGIRSSLVVAEVGLAMMLLIVAGLLTRSFTNLLSWEPGFEREHLLTIWTFLSPGVYPDRQQLPVFYDGAVEELSALPGVTSVATASAGPMFGGGDGSAEVLVEGRPVPLGERPTLRWFDVHRHYFATMGIPLVRGRGFEVSDRWGAPRVALVNETAARLLFGEKSPLGQRITMPLLEMTMEIVGVVADVAPIDPNLPVDPEVYWPFAQVPRWASYIILRTTGDPALQATVVGNRLTAMAPTIKLSRPATLPELVDRRLVGPRFSMLLIGVFAGVALLLAAGGVYGVLAYTVANRTRELGIRMALGANRGKVVRLVVYQGMAPALLGSVVGVLGALAAAGVVSRFLHGVSPTDLSTIGAVTGTLLTVALVASWLPARRATRIDPARSLRAE